MKGIVRGGMNNGKYANGSVVEGKKLRIDNTRGHGKVAWSLMGSTLSSVAGICKSIDGALWVARAVYSNANSLQKFDLNGGFIQAINAGATPKCVDIDSAGNLYVAQSYSTAQPSMSKYNSAGVLVWRGPNATDAYTIKVDNDNNIYLGFGPGTTVTAGIRKYDENKNVLWTKTDLGQCNDIAVDDDNNIYCAQTGTLRKLAPDGTEIWRTPAGILYNNKFMSVSLSPDGNIFVGGGTAVGSLNLAKLDNSGNLIWSIILQLVTLVRCDENGNVYCATNNDTISIESVIKLDPDGNKVWSKSDINNAYSLLVDGDNVYAGYMHGISTRASLAKYEGETYYTILN
jgi:streptogramin lyase